MRSRVRLYSPRTVGGIPHPNQQGNKDPNHIKGSKDLWDEDRISRDTSPQVAVPIQLVWEGEREAWSLLLVPLARAGFSLPRSFPGYSTCCNESGSGSRPRSLHNRNLKRKFRQPGNGVGDWTVSKRRARWELLQLLSSFLCQHWCSFSLESGTLENAAVPGGTP